ncbi:MAG: tetratricopeptide repeat protein [Verrucomicrobiota bacterium]|nr:tetratricopeptide repeat protein [Verrucomicrobiota bacterium]
MTFLRLAIVAPALFAAILLRGAEPTSSPEQTLKELVAREQALLADAAKNKDSPNFDSENFKSQLQQVADAYETLLNAQPDFTEAHVAYGQMLWKIDMRKEAVAHLLTANKLNPDIPLVKNLLGDYLAEDGRPLEALPYFLAAIKLAPNEPLYHYNLGLLLYEARADFLKTGQWTRAKLDQNMLKAFRRAAELAPDRIEFAYRYAEAFNDFEAPDWDAALAVWRSLEPKVAPGFDRQVIVLQEANILLKQKKSDKARALLATVTEPRLAGPKEKLIAQLPAEAVK